MLQVVGKDAVVGVGFIDNLVIYVERDVPREQPHLRWLADALSTTTRAHHKRTAHLHVVELAGRTGVRDGPRDAFARLARELDGSIGAAAFVVPSGGFIASVVRSLITGILVIAGRQTPTRTFSGVDEALAWLAGQCGEVPARASVERALEALR